MQHEHLGEPQQSRAQSPPVPSTEPKTCTSHHSSALKHLYNSEEEHPTLQTGPREQQPTAISLAQVRDLTDVKV